MLVEFVGCSGAGKTTCVAAVLRSLRSRGRVADCSMSLIAANTRTGWVHNLSIRNLILNVLLVPWFAVALVRHTRFCLFALLCILRYERRPLVVLQRCFSQLRHLASDQLLRHLTPRPEFILIDEGTICGVHNVLVYPKRQPSPQELSRYAELAPKPDLVIHIDTPLEVALTRTKARPDPPMRFHTLPERLRFVEAGYKIHLLLGQCEGLCQKWRAFSGSGESGQGTITDEIVGTILKQEEEVYGKCQPVG